MQTITELIGLGRRTRVRAARRTPTLALSLLVVTGLCSALLACSRPAAEGRQGGVPGVSLPPIETAAQGTAVSRCPGAEMAWRSAELAESEGRWLRALHQYRKATSACPERAGPARAALEARLPRSTRRRGVEEALELAAQARSAGDEGGARALEAELVLNLESQTQAALSVTPRWDYRQVVLPKAGRFLLFTRGSEILGMDAQSGALVFRVPLPARTDLRTAEYHPAAGKLVIAGVTEQGLPEVHVLDARTGAPFRRFPGMRWAFDAEGSRLIVGQIDSMGDGAYMSLALLDPRSGAALGQVRPPAERLTKLDHLELDPTRRSLAALWETGVSIVDLATDRVVQLDIGRPSSFGFSASGARFAFGDAQGAGVWERATGESTRWPRGACPNAVGRLSPDGNQLAIACGDTLWLWSVGRAGPGTSRRLPASVRELSWFASSATLLVRLDGAPDEYLLFDAARGRSRSLVTAGEELHAALFEAELVLVAGDSGPRLLRVGAGLELTPLALPECRYLARYAHESGARAVFDCLDPPAALIVEPAATAPSVSPTSGLESRLDGAVLVGVGTEAVELRSSSRGALLPYSPEVPGRTAREGQLRGSSLVSGWTDPALGYRWSIAELGAELRIRGQARKVEEQCDGAESAGVQGVLGFSLGSAPAICDRLSGAVIGRFPATVQLGRYSRPDISEDGRFVLTDRGEPRLYGVADGREIPLSDPPSEARFASAELITGYDAAGRFGVWDAASGRRLAVWSERVGEIPVAVSADLELAVVTRSSRAPSVHDLRTGRWLFDLDAHPAGDVRFGATGVLSVIEQKGISFWRRAPGASRERPRLERVGRLLLRPDADQGVFLAEGGEFALSAPLEQYRRLLRCEIGMQELPLELCAEALLDPGVAARALGLRAE